MSAESFYRFKLGAFECIVVSDGFFTYPHPAQIFFVNAPQEDLARVLREHNLKDERFKAMAKDELARYVDTQIVELTWLIGQFCLLNRWLTVLQVPTETAEDEADFGPHQYSW